MITDKDIPAPVVVKKSTVPEFSTSKYAVWHEKFHAMSGKTEVLQVTGVSKKTADCIKASVHSFCKEGGLYSLSSSYNKKTQTLRLQKHE